MKTYPTTRVLGAILLIVGAVMLIADTHAAFRAWLGDTDWLEFLLTGRRRPRDEDRS